MFWGFVCCTSSFDTELFSMQLLCERRSRCAGKVETIPKFNFVFLTQFFQQFPIILQKPDLFHYTFTRPPGIDFPARLNINFVIFWKQQKNFSPHKRFSSNIYSIDFESTFAFYEKWLWSNQWGGRGWDGYEWASWCEREFFNSWEIEKWSRITTHNELV